MSTNKKTFVITRFKNASGTVSWRLAGWVNGVRIRKNFKSREEAAAEMAAKEMQTLQAFSGLRSGATYLTDPQLREAEDAFRRLVGHPRSMLFYLDYAFTNYREPSQQKTLTEAVSEYVAVKQSEFEKALISTCQIRAIRDELKKLRQHFPSGSISHLTSNNLTKYLGRGNPALKTHNNRRSILSTFFKFAAQNDWVATNPVEKTPHYRIRHRRGSAETITPEKAKNLMAYLEGYEDGKLVPYFSPCLFAGIRPSARDGEVARLLPEHIRLNTGVILIEPEVSKVRMKRMVTIQPNLSVWLQAYPFKPTKPSYIEYHRLKINKLFKLTHDVLRHTFISMFVGKFRSMGEAALQAGNSESIIRKHYLDLKTSAEADQFFGILPSKPAPAAAENNSDKALSLPPPRLSPPKCIHALLAPHNSREQAMAQKELT